MTPSGRIEAIEGRSKRRASRRGVREAREGVQQPPYRVVCISLYRDDLLDLDAKVRRLKDRGQTFASRSALIRYALRQLDVERVVLARR